MRGRRPLVGMLLLVVGGSVGCGPSTPSPSPSPDGSEPAAAYPVACVSLPEGDCAAVVAAVEPELPAGAAIRSMVVGSFGCLDGAPDCPDGLVARPNGSVAVETIDGVLRSVPVALVAGELGTGVPVVVPSVQLTTTSPPAPGPVLAVSLGHCGLWSPIDVDRSLWDPIGFVDGDDPAYLNASAGTFRLLEAARAEFVAETGFTVGLVRRLGPKSYPLCD